jgi:hypothetical protein
MNSVDIADKKKDNGMCILLTAPENPGGKEGRLPGWGDALDISELKNRIKTLAAKDASMNLGNMEAWFNDC